MRRAMGLSVAILLAAAGCSKSTPTEIATNKEPAAAPSGAAAPTAQVGLLSGTATANAIVVLQPKAALEFASGDPPAMDQVSATFTPDLLFVRTGQPVEFRNSDDTLHNVHVGNVDTRESSFNVAIPTGEKYIYTFSKDGFYHVGCDIHPAMSAEIFSASTPFVTRTGPDGGFSFAEVPPGAYQLKVLAGADRTEQPVEVKAGNNSVTVK